MTRDKMYFRLCLMMAFQATLERNGKKDREGLAESALDFARQMDAFCDSYVSKAFPISTLSFVDEPGVDSIDNVIDRHIEELRTQEVTCLPQDRDALIQMSDRRQQRKSRRLQWRFYVSAKEEKLSDMVLRYLYEEIEYAEMEAGAA